MDFWLLLQHVYLDNGGREQTVPDTPTHIAHPHLSFSFTFHLTRFFSGKGVKVFSKLPAAPDYAFLLSYESGVCPAILLSIHRGPLMLLIVLTLYFFSSVSFSSLTLSTGKSGLWKQA